MSTPKINFAPIAVSQNGRYFVDASGDPFFWMSDTAWPLFSQYTLQEAEKYLAARGKQGFNVVKGVLAWPGGTTFEREKAFPNYNGDFPWLDNNPATPSEAYFNHVEHLVRLAGEHGVILSMLPVWGYHVSDIKLFNVDNAYTYGLW